MTTLIHALRHAGSLWLDRQVDRIVDHIVYCHHCGQYRWKR